MIEERLEQTFTNRGYRRLNSNAAGIYLFYQAEATVLTIVSVVRVITGNELGKEQYKNILEQIKNNFRSSYPNRMRMLSLILTEASDKVKHLSTESNEGEHWILDLRTNRLIIYETVTEEFSELRQNIETLLTEEDRLKQADQENFHSTAYDNNGYSTGQRQTKRSRSGFPIFTLMNTCVIVINIIVFLTMQYTPFYGGYPRMLAKGALSWYYVITEKEYYRVLTSMFMHSDFSHLFNNMLVLFFVGDNLERAAGKLRYLILYFGAGILAGMTSIGYNMWKENGQYLMGESVFSIGASGAIFGIVGAMLYIVIINRGRLEDISTRHMVLFVIFSLYGGIANTQIDQVAHVGGFLAGILLAAIVYRRPKRRFTVEQPFSI